MLNVMQKLFRSDITSPLEQKVNVEVHLPGSHYLSHKIAATKLIINQNNKLKQILLDSNIHSFLVFTFYLNVSILSFK